MARVLGRLAIAWAAFWALLIIWGLAHGGTFEKGAAVAIPTVLGGPPLLLLLFAWVFAPRK